MTSWRNMPGSKNKAIDARSAVQRSMGLPDSSMDASRTLKGYLYLGSLAVGELHYLDAEHARMKIVDSRVHWCVSVMVPSAPC